VTKSGLPDHQQRLWDEYASAEGAGPRADAISKLRLFISAVDAVELTERDSWALALVQRCFDSGGTPPIRQPLFAEVIFPALLRGLLEGSRVCARWLGSAPATLFSPSQRSLLPEGLRSPVDLLAFAADGGKDARASASLAAELARLLGDAVHEVPAGVLYDSHGASASELAELQSDLELFCVTVDQLDLRDHHAALIDKCRYHFDRYQGWLSQPTRSTSFSEYLDQHK